MFENRTIHFSFLTVILIAVFTLIAVQAYRTHQPSVSSASPPPSDETADATVLSPVVLNGNAPGIMAATPAFSNPSSTQGDAAAMVTAPSCASC